jgi:hypothetical protein
VQSSTYDIPSGSFSRALARVRAKKTGEHGDPFRTPHLTLVRPTGLSSIHVSIALSVNQSFTHPMIVGCALEYAAAYTKLNQPCEALKLSIKGNKTELVKRLQDHAAASSVINNQESASDVDVECATILVAESETGEEEEMKTLAKDSFTRVLNKEELFVEDAGGELAVGNRSGLDLWARLSTLERNVGRIPRLEADI